jgi:hypothetical protein
MTFSRARPLRASRRLVAAVLAVAALGARAGAGHAETVTLTPDRDGTLYESATGALANGAGEHLFVGRTGEGSIRRAVLHFDLSALPANAVVQSATLRLELSKTTSAATPVTVHRALAGWGEGASDASGEEGQGASSTADDATWIHRFFPATPWSQTGGDFVSAASATASASGEVVTWTGAGLAADVQTWIADSASNHGWLLRGGEASFPTAKRFDSSEESSADERPQLTVVYTTAVVGGPCAAGALCLNDDRFEITVDWTRPNGQSGVGTPVKLTADTGYFWFFGSANVEVVIKVLGCAGNGNYWVFAGGLTNVLVEITVRDTVTGAVKTYTNPQRTPFQPIQDVRAFPCG